MGDMQQSPYVGSSAITCQVILKVKLRLGRKGSHVTSHILLTAVSQVTAEATKTLPGSRAGPESGRHRSLGDMIFKPCPEMTSESQ